MENGESTPSPLPSDSPIDFTLIDQLLSDGFFLEATDVSNLNSTSFYFSTSETSIPNLNANPSHEMDEFSVKKKLMQAINCLKDSLRDKDVLIQTWIPVKRGDRQVLTTDDQPFSLDPNSKNLADYRLVSQSYQFSADEESKGFFGLPGRVFLKKSPEWTPDVRFFKTEDYPRVSHAQLCDVKGSLALPVFELGTGVCLGVAEIVTTNLKLDYGPELENICKALEAVDLKSTNILTPSHTVDLNKSYESTLTEIGNVLKFVCYMHKLPLAQTWASCVQQRKGDCHHSNESQALCISTIDSACYVADQKISGFNEACCKQHLLKGEGLAGKAFLTNQPCFAEDITAFSETEYPLVHHARVFNLCASVAIRLRSMYNETADYVLEFFLPSNCTNADDQMMMVDSISCLIQQRSQYLRVILDQELAQETCPSKESKGKEIVAPLANQGEPQGESSHWDNSVLDLHQESGTKTTTEGSGNFSSNTGKLNTSSKKKRTKTEKNITLQVLRQHFAGSLKEAAKNIGVCPTTLKRICRQHGISRWPSRKIKKVDHSLRKLQVVIDSVQGAEGSIPLSSFYNKYPELVSPNAPGSNNMLTSKMTGQDLHPVAGPPLKSPSSSGDHGSSSSSYNCCVNGVRQSSLPVNHSEEDTGGMLKRANSEAQLHEKVQQGTKLLIRSTSHKVFSTDVAPTNTVAHVDTFKVKAGFGQEKIRFTLQPMWGFMDLRQEVYRRFNIDINGSRYNMKYLDDDDEWVLLTCDADLEECKDIYRSSKSTTIKLSVHQAYDQPNLGTSFGVNGRAYDQPNLGTSFGVNGRFSV